MGHFEPVVFFFVLGALARLARSDLKLPSALYEGLSIFLLLAIGLKGGVELARYELGALLGPCAAVLAMGLALPLLAYPLLRLGRLPRPDAASLAAHYGSVSVVTFAVGVSYLNRLDQSYEGYLTVFLVLLEMPAIVVGVLLARGGHPGTRWVDLLREVFFGKSVFLLAGGLVIGWMAGPDDIEPLNWFYFDLFKGVLSLFLLEMGMVAASRIGDLRRFGPFLLAFAVIFPLVASVLGGFTGWWLGLSAGGITLLATLAASASYIAAPAAMRIAVPEANPALSIGASLGITFPFNLIVGIPLYHWLGHMLAEYGDSVPWL